MLDEIKELRRDFKLSHQKIHIKNIKNSRSNSSLRSLGKSPSFRIDGTHSRSPPLMGKTQKRHRSNKIFDTANNTSQPQLNLMYSPTTTFLENVDMNKATTGG